MHEETKMEPLQAIAMPTHGVLVEINAQNSWQAGTAGVPVLMAYIATNSKEPLSFVSLHTAGCMSEVLGVASRPSHLDDMPYGVVIEICMGKPLEAGQTVEIALAQVGASVYYPPQPIDDAK